MNEQLDLIAGTVIDAGFTRSAPVQVDEAKLVAIAARVYDEGAMDSPEDYPLQYGEAVQYGRDVARAVVEYLRGGGR